MVHGSGLDEVAIHGFTQAVRLAGGELDELEITPEQAGLRRLPLEQIVGGAPEQNARRLRALFTGAGKEADETVVALNAGALLLTAGKGDTLRQGTAAAIDAIRSGRAGEVLDRFIEASRG